MWRKSDLGVCFLFIFRRRFRVGIRIIVTGGVGIKMTHLPLWSGGTATVTKPLRAL